MRTSDTATAVINIVVVDDVELVRWAVRNLLTPFADVRIVAEVTDPSELLAIVKAKAPQLVSLNLAMDGALTALSLLSQATVPPRIMAHAVPDDTTLIAKAVRLGCAGIVRKADDPATLITTLRAVDAGHAVMPDDIARAARGNLDTPAAVLSLRERQVMEMLARGLTNREIASNLEISVKTVDTHRGHVLKKLQLRNNSELTRFALRHGIIEE